eukprot:7419605-Ditylum_brightwellii.AAC.1
MPGILWLRQKFCDIQSAAHNFLGLDSSSRHPSQNIALRFIGAKYGCNIGCSCLDVRKWRDCRLH